MKRLLSLVLVTIALIVTLFVPAALAEDLANGAKIFSANCAACHIGGNNLVNAAKTLKQSDLEKYDMASTDAIQTQVTQGKAAMPAFAGRFWRGLASNLTA